jgi:hypothetical protein
MMRMLAVIGFGVSCLLADNEPKQRVQATNTQRVDFAPGGTLRLENSTGELMVQGWDRPDVEITTIRSAIAARELEQVRIAVERRGDELVVTTAFPRHGFLSPPFPPGTSFDLEYYIKAPRNARLIVAHYAGDVHVDEMTGDIRVTARQGEITLRLPGEGQYAIDARSKFGGVNSDFPGHETRKLWLAGHQFTNETSPAAHKIYLRIGYGDILVWKTLRLPTPAPPAH